MKLVIAVHLNGPGRMPPQHLYQVLGGRVPIVGVSKRSVPGLSAQFEVMREEETPPLLVTSAGVDIGAAAKSRW